jgi:5-methylcytosine-specific restriction endonuclease McrA
VKPVRKTSLRLRNAAAVRRYKRANLYFVLESGRKSDRKRYAKRRATTDVRGYWNAWRANNIDRERARGRANAAVRKARLLASEGSYSYQDVVSLYAAQQGHCAVFWCRAELAGNYHIDHIIALACGGSNYPSNLQLTCPSCNTSKADSNMFDFYLRKAGGGHLRI